MFNIHDKEHFRALGREFGYPSCCIEFFCNHADEGWWQDYTEGTNFIGTGFIECPDCCSKPVMVMAHIKANRNPELVPFPEE